MSQASCAVFYCLSHSGIAHQWQNRISICIQIRNYISLTTNLYFFPHWCANPECLRYLARCYILTLGTWRGVSFCLRHSGIAHQRQDLICICIQIRNYISLKTNFVFLPPIGVQNQSVSGILRGVLF